MALSGSLREIGPTDVIQLIAMGRKTGILTVAEAGEVISVYFREGRIFHAASGKLSGPEVVYDLLTRGSGKFSFDTTEVNCPTTIQDTPETLMLEGVRRIDHWEHMRDVLPPENARLLPVPEGERTGQPEDSTPEVARVLELVDGERTLGDVVRESGLARFQACDSVYQLLVVGWVLVGPETADQARREVSAESIRFADITPELLERIVDRIGAL